MVITHTHATNLGHSQLVQRTEWKKRTKGRTNGRTDTTDRITFDAVTVGKYSFELILYQ